MGLFDIFKGTKSDSSHNEPQQPRLHHYEFAYRALPGLAFADPFGPLGLAQGAQEAPKERLVKFWNLVGIKIPKSERVSDTGLIAVHAPFGPDFVIVLVTMPKPLRLAEAYFVAILYPKSWFSMNDVEGCKPVLKFFILENSKIEGAEGATLRVLTKDGHGAIRFGVPATPKIFVKEIQDVLLKPVQPITWVQSKPWDFEILNGEKEQNQSPPQIHDPTSRVPKRHGTLLVMDNEDAPLQALRQIFEDEYNVLLVEDGPTAIELAQANEIDVAVLNIRMNGMSGIEVLKRLKSFKVDIEVIMMTGLETIDTIRDSMRLGACDYINKPFDVATMRAAVSKAMQRRVLRPEASATPKTSDSEAENVMKHQAQPSLLNHDVSPEDVAQFYFHSIRSKLEAGLPDDIIPDDASLGLELVKDEWIYFNVFGFDYSAHLVFGETTTRHAVINPFFALVVKWLKNGRAPAITEPRILITFDNVENPKFFEAESGEPRSERLKRRVLTYAEALKTPCSLGQNYMIALTFASLCGVDSTKVDYITGISRYFSDLKIEQTKNLKSFPMVF